MAAFISIVFLLFTNFVTLVFLCNRIIENLNLKAKIKHYEDVLFINEKALAKNKDFLEALSQLDDEFPG